MPQPVAELVEAARIGAPAQLALLVEIGDVGDFRTQAPVHISPTAARNLQFPEVAGKRHLPVVFELLVMEDQHRIAIDRIRKGSHRLRSERPTGIDAADLGDEQRVQLP